MCVLTYEKLFYLRFLTFELDIILENLDDLSSHRIYQAESEQLLELAFFMIAKKLLELI